MRVLLVDDHALFAQSLAIVLSDFPSIEQFSNIKSVDEIEATIERDKPDILLMDINLGRLSEEDGLLLAQNLLQKYPTQKIVVLSGYDLPVYRKEAEKLGAKGFINKDIEPEELLHILEAINNGSTYFEKDGTYIEELTETEKQVLRMLASGIKRKEIDKRGGHLDGVRGVPGREKTERAGQPEGHHGPSEDENPRGGGHPGGRGREILLRAGREEPGEGRDAVLRPVRPDQVGVAGPIQGLHRLPEGGRRGVAGHQFPRHRRHAAGVLRGRQRVHPADVPVERGGARQPVLRQIPGTETYNLELRI